MSTNEDYRHRVDKSRLKKEFESTLKVQTSSGYVTSWPVWTGTVRISVWIEVVECMKLSRHSLDLARAKAGLRKERSR
jgi:hypothetical protein